MIEGQIDIRDLSRRQWRTTSTGTEGINCGSMLRIADAVENMAKDRVQLERDLEHYKQRNRENIARIDSLERSKAALRGVITRKTREFHNALFIRGAAK